MAISRGCFLLPLRFVQGSTLRSLHAPTVKVLLITVACIRIYPLTISLNLNPSLHQLAGIGNRYRNMLRIVCTSEWTRSLVKKCNKKGVGAGIKWKDGRHNWISTSIRHLIGQGGGAMCSSHALSPNMLSLHGKNYTYVPGECFVHDNQSTLGGWRQCQFMTIAPWALKRSFVRLGLGFRFRVRVGSQ